VAQLPILGNYFSFASVMPARVQTGRVYIELVNAPFLKAGGSGDEFRADIDRKVAKGWLVRHESGMCDSPKRARRCSPR